MSEASGTALGRNRRVRASFTCVGGCQYVTCERFERGVRLSTVTRKTEHETERR